MQKVETEGIDPKYLMCMMCEYSTHHTDGRIECDYEDDNGEVKPELSPNYECDAFEVYAPNLVAVLERLIKEFRGK